MKYWLPSIMLIDEDHYKYMQDHFTTPFFKKDESADLPCENLEKLTEWIGFSHNIDKLANVKIMCERLMTKVDADLTLWQIFHALAHANEKTKVHICDTLNTIHFLHKLEQLSLKVQEHETKNNREIGTQTEMNVPPQTEIHYHLVIPDTCTKKIGVNQMQPCTR